MIVFYIRNERLSTHVEITSRPVSNFKTTLAGFFIQKIVANIFGRSFPTCWFVDITSVTIDECMYRLRTTRVLHDKFVILTTFVKVEVIISIACLEFINPRLVIVDAILLSGISKRTLLTTDIILNEVGKQCHAQFVTVLGNFGLLSSCVGHDAFCVVYTVIITVS